jgi:hypothetical protein
VWLLPGIFILANIDPVARLLEINRATLNLVLPDQLIRLAKVLLKKLLV